MTRVLDLDKFVEEADKVKFNGKEYNVSSASTETLFSIEKVLQDSNDLETKLEEYTIKFEGETDVKEKVELNKKIRKIGSEISKLKIEAIPKQIFAILKPDNKEITQTEIDSWGFKLHIEFMKWWNEPFLVAGQGVQKEKEIKKAE